jgi:Zn-dependent M28 family amino/carboxypeptidase
MRKSFWIFILIVVFGVIFSCVPQEDHETVGINMVSEVNLREHIRFISHDLTEGRDTGSEGEKIAIEYIASQYAMNGILPGGDNGTYYQNFDLVKQTTKSVEEFAFVSGTQRYLPEIVKDYAAQAGIPEKELKITADLVFVGYGIDAPEYDWNDYENLDPKGKVLFMLMGEPSSEDPDFFKGKEMSDYGDLMYKLKVAGEKGAGGLVLVYDQKIGRYPWAMIARFFNSPRMRLKEDEDDASKMKFGSFVSVRCADEIAKLAGHSLDTLTERAGQKDFVAMDLGIQLRADIRSEIEDVPCQNTIGVVPGKIEDEYVLYTAHTDHMGIGRPIKGDKIYNGAVDNASGCASLIELGRVFASLPSPPQRSIILACVTAEEKGLLGSKYYAQNPTFPLNKTLAVINLDGILPWGRFKDFLFLGGERSNLGELAQQIADDNGMTLSFDLMPEENFYQRSDHYSLAQEGLPGGMLINGFMYVDKPEDWGLEELKKWLKTVYHHPNDEFTDEWKMETVVQVNQIAFQFGYRIAKLKERPVWNDDQPFKKVRQESLGE